MKMKMEPWLVTMMMMEGMMANIHVTRQSPSSTTKSHSRLSLYCHTDTPWFLCVWTSPRGDKQCAIQEHSVSSVCAGDERIVISGGDTTCSITINNVTARDWGNWMCLVQDGEEFQKDVKYINVQVASPSMTSITWEGHHQYHRDNNDSDVKILRVIEDTVTDIQCNATHGYPQPRVTWSGDPLDHVSGTSFHRNYNNVSHEYDVGSSIKYVASMNDTNATLRCSVRQENYYIQEEMIRIIVDPKPLPLVKDNSAETAGIIAGVILSLIFLLLILVLAIVFIIRRRRRRHRSESPTSSSNTSGGGDNSGFDGKQVVWSTRTSRYDVPGTRYDGNWSKMIHCDNLGQLSMDTTGDTGTGSRSTKTMSIVSDSGSNSVSDSFQTDRDIEHISVSLCPGPSLPETHFSETLGPLTTVYHHSAPYLDTPGYYKGPSSVRSADIMGGPGQGRDSGVSFLSSRPVSALDVYSPYHVPMRVSTPTCAGSKTSVSMFQCPHDCFAEKIEETDEGSGDTIEEMDEEEDVDSIRHLVNHGLDVGTDCMTDSSEDKIERVRRPTTVTLL